MKLCKDCKHCEPRPYKNGPIRKFLFGVDYEFAKCGAPPFADLVTGEAGAFCDLLRQNNDECGEDGKLWEAK